MNKNIKQAKWFQNSRLQTLLQTLEQDGGEARIVGGAVRNFLFKEEVGDIDIATTQLPKAVIAIGKKLKYKIVKTGESHGTIILCKKNSQYEITTLRQDIKTDGRHAEIIFGKNWLEDAKRRDFTINALYLDRHGKLYDPLGGKQDLENGEVKFIGNAEMRIKEDYLRILRFFRFHAFYGKSRPNVEGLKACVRCRENLNLLSGERIWQELKRLLQAQNPSISILWLQQSGILAVLLPSTKKYGLDILHGLLALEKKYKAKKYKAKKYKWPQDYFLRFMALVPPNFDYVKTIKKRLRLSNKQTQRLQNRILCAAVDWNVNKKQFMQQLYKQDSIEGVFDCLYLSISQAHVFKNEKLEKQLLAKLLLLQNYTRPNFPLQAQDLFKYGFKQGIELGKALKNLEAIWIDSHFTFSKKQLLAKLKN